MTKRITALLLSAVLCLSLTGTAFAAGEESAIRAAAGSNTVSVSLKGLTEGATYYLCSLLVKESEAAAEEDFKIVRSFNFRAREGGVFTYDFTGEPIPTLRAGNVLRLRVPGVDFGGAEYIEYTIPEAGIFTVTFNLNYEGAPTASSVKTEAGGLVAAADWPIPARPGWTFLGWFDAAEGGNEVKSDAVFAEDAILYAHWEKDEEPAGPVTAVSLPKTASVRVNGSTTLTAVLTPAKGEWKSIEWKSSDTGAATVAADAKDSTKAAVKGVKAGTAVITFTLVSENGETYAASCQVTVSKASSGGGGGGGGGSSASGDYSIGVSRTSNGSVSVNPTRADEGDTVTVTVRPHKGYELDKLTVKDADGRTIRVTEAGDGKFTFLMPDGKVTVEAAFKAVTAEPETAGPAAPVFTDVPAGFWAYDQITWAANKGIMGGYGNGIFAPNRSVTRQQLWMVLGRLNGSSPADMAAARAWAMSSGVSDGSNAASTMSRQQMVTMLYRYAQMKGYSTAGRADLSRFPDGGSVAGYAQEALSWAVANGVMGGTSAGTLNPGGTASRAHFAVFMQRFCVLYGIA